MHNFSTYPLTPHCGFSLWLPLHELPCSPSSVVSGKVQLSMHCNVSPCSDFLLVTESREERKHWIEALQEQNPALLSSEDHSLHIHPDTPQIPRRSDSSSSTSSNGVQHHHVVTHPSMLVTDHPARPGSPRHDIQKVASSDSCASMSVDYLDIRQLSIREGPSDTEEDNN